MGPKSSAGGVFPAGSLLTAATVYRCETSPLPTQASCTGSSARRNDADKKAMRIAADNTIIDDIRLPFFLISEFTQVCIICIRQGLFFNVIAKTGKIVFSRPSADCCSVYFVSALFQG
jgi:hypothetical protein